MSAYICRNVHLVKELTEGTDLDKADVLVIDNKIKSILPPSTASYPGATVIEGEGKTLLPGLIDMHVHLMMGKRNAWNLKDREDIPSRRAIDALRFAQWYLDYGYTTIRDVGDEEHFPAIAARDAINEGDFIGPRIKCSGLTVYPHTAGLDDFGFMSEYTWTPEDMWKAVRRQFVYGADLIKLYGSGSMMTPDGMSVRRIITPEEVKIAVAAAKLRGSYVAVHCHSEEGIGVMVDCGVHTVEHASFINDEACRKLDNNPDQGIVMTIACSCKEVNILEGQPENEIERFSKVNARRRDCLRNAYENYNIQIGWGTDMSIETMQKVPFIEWKQRKEEMGFSNIDMLKQATIIGARLMYLDDEIGTVKEGKLADLILVDGDPVEDINVMYQKPLHVMHNGFLVH